MCGTCGSKVGPFYSVLPKLKACGPLKIEKSTGKLIGRAAECNERRRKLETQWYGKQELVLEQHKMDQ